MTSRIGATLAIAALAASAACVPEPSGDTPTTTAAPTSTAPPSSAPPSTIPSAPTIDYSNKFAADYRHMLMITDDGGVTAWGSNSHSALGVIDDDETGPVEVPGVENVIAVATTDYSSLALRADGTVMSWGSNEYATLGTGDDPDHAGPQVIEGLSDIVEIEAGVEHALARRDDGTVFAWGYNSNGEVGTGGFETAFEPVEIGVDNAVAITAGRHHSAALLDDGTVVAWGLNMEGQAGHDFDAWVHVTEPTAIAGLANVEQIEATGWATLALLKDGTVRSWGSNYSGELGVGGSTITSDVPLTVTGLSGITSISAGCEHVFARRADGTTWAWGTTSANVLLNDSDIDDNDASTPIAVEELRDADFVKASGHNSFAVIDGELFGWGENNSGIVDRAFPSSTRETPHAIPWP